MTLFLDFWNTWAFMFRPIPNGDPYVAAFALVIVMIATFKVLRSASKHFAY